MSTAKYSSVSFEQEVKQGNRFEFGKNWSHFLSSLNDSRINIATDSLYAYLGDIRNKTFVDVGSGSGLFSLAARKLGATVFSFDYDPTSLACTRELKNRYFPNDNQWKIEEGSVLDLAYLKKLGQYAIVYSWGVLHHTGKMWEALENIDMLVSKGGCMFIALYNDQQKKSRYWWRIKKLYNSSNIGRFIVLSMYIPIWGVRAVFAGIIKYGNPFGQFTHYRKRRGMSLFHDWIDWLGGFPFEVASPEAVVDFYLAKGYTLRKIKTTNSSGCNQFVFTKEQPAKNEDL